MSEELYRVVFRGALTGDYDYDTSRQRFSDMFGVPIDKTYNIFSGRMQVLKENVPRATAMKYLVRLAEAGCKCDIEKVPDDQPQEEKPVENERRQPTDRRKEWRREPRAGSITPDRRLLIRRKIDRKAFSELLKERSPMPLKFKAYSPKATAEYPRN